MRPSSVSTSAPASKLVLLALPGAVLAGAIWLVDVAPAYAFPLVDPSNETSFAGQAALLNQANVPQTSTELAPTDARSLTRQLELVNGPLLGAGAMGWVILPRLGVSEVFTDNVFQANSPRQWDLATLVSPGVAIAADTSRLQLRLDYSPTLVFHDRYGSQNSLGQQLNTTGLLTAVPDLLFLDIRAVSGVQSLTGNPAGFGGIGAGTIGLIGPTSVLSATGGALGSQKQNLVQTSSVSLSPYLLHRFGDYGSGKLGFSVNSSGSTRTTGFATLPFPTESGRNSQRLFSTEEILHLETGEFIEPVKDSLDLSQSRSATEFGQLGTTINGDFANRRVTSTRQTINDQVRYAITRQITVSISGGHEDIQYRGMGDQRIVGATWSFGTELTPNPDSSIRINYGHQQGATSVSGDVRYALTARTVLTGSYNTLVGTQLENLQQQLGSGVVNGYGSLVNARTGGTLFGANNSLGVQPGLYRTKTLNVGLTTTLDRDTFSINGIVAQQSLLGASVASNNAETKTLTLQWLHLLQPDLNLTAIGSYSTTSRSAGTLASDRSWAGTVGLQYFMTDTLTGSVRYAFYDRQSGQAQLKMYENLVIVGLTKQF